MEIERLISIYFLLIIVPFIIIVVIKMGNGQTKQSNEETIDHKT